MACQVYFCFLDALYLTNLLERYGCQMELLNWMVLRSQQVLTETLQAAGVSGIL
uniref:Uncharacterized protein n=1 Tax=Arundo donax TaxID=35708 RepID=A0A0A9HCP1_ARUDO